MNPYDFTKFLARMASLDYPDIISEAAAECGRVEASSYSVTGAPKRREMGSTEYAAKIKAFLWFMRTGTRPGSATDDEFASYRPVVQALVDKGQFRPEALNQF